MVEHLETLGPFGIEDPKMNEHHHMSRTSLLSDRRILIAFSLLVVLLGCFFRLYQINQSDFVFYDEGYYLNYSRRFGEIIQARTPFQFPEMTEAVYAFIRICLGTGKALWFLLADSRFFFGGLKAWFFPRVLSSIFGILCLPVAYRFARKFYHSRSSAWLTVIVLALLPSHVFYSRVGMQETLSTFLMLLGFYYYLFPRKIGPRTFTAGALFALTFFANYRLIICPVFVALAEIYLGFTEKRRPGFRKYLWFLLTYLAGVFIIGNIDYGRNTTVTFAWMLHQADLAQSSFAAVNFLSYPYYLFRLENWIFGLFFFGQVYWVFKKQWPRLFPFLLVILQMALFSMASEKGARYLCVVTPFLAMSVAHLIVTLIKENRDEVVRYSIGMLAVLMLGMMGLKSAALARARGDYRTSAEYLLSLDQDVSFVSTQPYVQRLYTSGKDRVADCPHRFELLALKLSEGYRYLVIEPQAYISWTQEGKRFDPKLTGYMRFVQARLEPLRTYDHFDPVLLERFVFEHSEHLVRSIRFLELANKEGFGKLYIYDLNQVVPVVMTMLGQYHAQN